MPELSLPDVTLHYEIAGSGPPLMLIPGMLSDGASWFPVIELLATQHQLILLDPRGAGRTLPMDAPISLQALAGDMLALADHLGLQRFAVLGHSMGALVTLAMAADAPERLSHVIALASTPRPSARLPAIFASLCETRAQGDDRLWLHALFPWLFHDSFFRDPEAVAAAIQAGIDYPYAQSLDSMRHQTAALARLDLKSMAQSLPMPALALLGAEDALIAPGPAQAAWTNLGAQVEVLKDAAHSLHWDRPDAVAARITAFLT
ncbi:MAG: alpha/beta fold hydrolase [Paracoccaceae bacterium]|nr:alpha/beta fold hydrolase [Paracoccaceae bacterium]